MSDEITKAAAWLYEAGYFVVPKIPTEEMVTASIKALEEAGIAQQVGVTRRKKHAVRIIHANLAGHSSIEDNQETEQ